MGYKEILTILTILISSGGFIWYMYTVYFGRTRPHLYTWLIWGLVVSVACIGQVLGGAGVGAWFLAAAALFCFARAVAAITHGVKAITGSDKVCLSLCLVAVIIWQLTAEPLLAVLIVTGIDLAGYFPMSRNVWHNPTDENMLSHILISVSFSISLFALESYNLLTLFYPATICIAQWSFVSYLLWRRRIQRLNCANTALN